MQKKLDLTQLIESGAHFGHLTRRWNPKMKQYIFMEKNGIHIIDLKKTQQNLYKAAEKITEIVSQGKKVLFVGTKKQAKDVMAKEASRSESYWVSERWLGGMLTNFTTIRKSVKRLQTIDKMEQDGTFEKITKKEILMHSRERDKLRKVLEGIENMTRIPGAMFIVDIKKENIAIREALRLNIPVFAIVDTNCDPGDVDYVIPSNDDAVRAIEVISKYLADAIIEGNKKAKELRAEEVAEKERVKKQKAEEAATDKKEGKARIRKVRFDDRGAKKSDKTSQKEAEKAAADAKAKAEKEVKETAPATETPDNAVKSNNEESKN